VLIKQLQISKNSILEFVDFKIFWGGMPPHPLVLHGFAAQKKTIDLLGAES